ncbi:MAG TPA: sodium/solute symporter [Thermoanaerobaculia bacterium]|nr:sodium/solute symporter [Thermoanaerobaculia bacterium]
MRALDIAIVFGYLAAVVAAGAFFARRQKTTAQYFLGGRHVPWWAISASIVATETSTITFISVPGLIYRDGGDFAFLQLVFGYLLGRVVISALLIPSYFRRELLTVYQLLQTRFGGAVKALAAGLFVTMRTIADGVRLLLTAFVLAAVFAAFAGPAGADAVVVGSILVIGVVMILFTFFGGMEAVIWIEVVQLGIYVAGAIAAALVLIGNIPGGWDSARALGEQYGKFRLFHFEWDWAKPFTFWAGLIGGCFLTMSTHGTDQYLVQRYLCTDKPRKATFALLTSGVVVLAQFTGFLLIGLLLFAFYRPFENGWALAGDRVFPDFITRHLPSGLSGLVVAAIFAAAMSSSLNSIAATAVSDLYRPIVPGRSDRHYLSVSRWLTLAAGIAQIAVAVGIRHMTRSALDAALSVASILNGPVLGVFLLGAFSRRAGTPAAFAGMAAGLVAVVAVWRLTPVAWPWYTLVGSATTLAVGSILGLVSRPREAIA